MTCPASHNLPQVEHTVVPALELAQQQRRLWIKPSQQEEALHNRGPQRQKQRGHLLKTTPRPYFAISPECRERMTFNHKDGMEQGVGVGAERTEQPVGSQGPR